MDLNLSEIPDITGVSEIRKINYCKDSFLKNFDYIYIKSFSVRYRGRDYIARYSIAINSLTMNVEIDKLQILLKDGDGKEINEKDINTLEKFFGGITHTCYRMTIYLKTIPWKIINIFALYHICKWFFLSERFL